MSEHDEQTYFFSWIDSKLTQYPILALMHAIPNGGKLPNLRNKSGHRWSPEANKLKAEGMRKGVPDVHLPYPSGPYAGLWIEFKYDKNKPTKEQDITLKCLAILGYSVHICYDWLSASDVTLAYLKQKDGVILTAVVTIWKDREGKTVEVKEQLFDLLGGLYE